MHYMTMVLELLEQHPEVMEPLKRRRLVLPTVERLAIELKTRHEAWVEELSQSRPGSERIQLRSEALEIALDEFRSRSPCDWVEQPDDGRPPYRQRPDQHHTDNE